MAIDPITGLAIARGGKTLFDFFGANSAAKKRQKLKDAEIKRLKGIQGTKFIDVNRIDSASKRAIVEQSAKSGRRIDKSLGLDVGQAQGGIAEGLAGQLASNRASNIKADEIGTANRNTQVDQELARLEGVDVGGGNLAGTLGSLFQTGVSAFAQSKAKKQAEEKATELANIAPRPGINPASLAGDPSRFERSIPTQQQKPDLRSLIDQNLSGANRPAPEPTELDKAREALQIFNETGFITKGFQFPKEGKPPTDFASKFSADFDKKQSAFEKNEAKFRTDNQFSRDKSASPFTAPNVDTEFDLIRPTIDRELGAGSADSVRALLGQKFGGGQPTPSSGATIPLSNAGQFAQQLRGGQIESNPQAIKLLTSPDSEFYVSDWATTPPEKQQILIELITQKLFESQ